MSTIKLQISKSAISKLPVLWLILTATLPIQALAAEPWLLVSQSEALNSGQKITLEIIKPQAVNQWPDTLKMKLSGNDIHEEIILSANPPATDDKPRRTYVGLVSQHYAGVVRAELVDQSSNRLLLLAAIEDAGATQIVAATTPAAAATTPAAADSNQPTAKSNAAVVVIAKPGDVPALSANEPMYFLVGHSSERGANSRFQLSFKYRPFDPEGSIAGYAPFLSNLYFAYTQTTLWDWGGHSSPFRDTSYKPSLFYRWQHNVSQNGMAKVLPNELRSGIEHESNGQGGVDSRSLNTAFINPIWNFNVSGGRRFTFFPKFQYYLEKQDNPDIQRYRGYVDWQMRFGREDGLMLSGLYRAGTAGYNAGQLDLSYPISDRIFARTGAFVHLQLFSGYGETLLDYNKRSDTQLRIGFSIAR